MEHHISQFEVGALNSCVTASVLYSIKMIDPAWSAVPFQFFDDGVRRKLDAKASDGLSFEPVFEQLKRYGISAETVSKERLHRLALSGKPVVVGLTYPEGNKHAVVVLGVDRPTGLFILYDPGLPWIALVDWPWISDRLPAGFDTIYEIESNGSWSWVNARDIEFTPNPQVPDQPPRLGVRMMPYDRIHSWRNPKEHAELSSLPFALRSALTVVDPRWGRFTPKEFDQYIRSESALSPEQGIDLEAALTSLEPLGLARGPVSEEEAQRRAQRGRPTLLIDKEARQPHARVLVGWDEPSQHWVVSDPRYPTVQVQTWESLSHALLSHESGIQAIWTCPLSEPDCPMD